MIGGAVDRLVAVFSPTAAIKRMQARKLLQRHYSGAESNRLTAHRNPQNRSADQELRGPSGADSMRAWARMLVRDNAYAWGVVDTIVSSVVGCGIQLESRVETPEGDDNESLNSQRESVFEEWAEVCDLNGQLDWHSLQSLVQREIVEAGECLIHLVDVPTDFRGIRRPVPFAVELIEADRLANDLDTLHRSNGDKKVVRGIEFDDLGKPVAYYVYPEHPTDSGILRQEAKRIDAANILHLYRKDRIGQTRGVSWFAPVVSWLRDLGTYLDNELVASAVASCFTAAIKTNTPTAGLGLPSGEDSTDADGNTYDQMQPGMIMHLNPDEDIDFGSPGRPNGNADSWISLMLRGIAVGTGLSYETVSRDYSKTNYSSNRASQLEDRRRFRCWQQYLIHRLCVPVWDRFCDAAALQGLEGFPSAVELEADRRNAAPVLFQATGWEWVDPRKEQQASNESVQSNLSTYADELGAKGKNWRKIMRQRQKEEAFLDSLKLKPVNEEEVSPQDSEQPAAEEPLTDSPIDPNVDAGVATDLTLNGAQIAAAVEVLEKLNSGTLVAEAAIELLVAVGLPREVVEPMVQTQEQEAEEPPEPVVPMPPMANAFESPEEKETEADDAEEEEAVAT